jgi:hypothetical protein
MGLGGPEPLFDLDDSAASMVGTGFAGDDDKNTLIIFGRRNKYFLIDIPVNDNIYVIIWSLHTSNSISASAK